MPGLITDAPPPERDGACEGCRGETEPRPRPPLLTDDLVIAARARSREPELPEATVQAALAASPPDAAAAYDVVMLAPPDVEAARNAWALAVEFARHEQRVFWVKPATAPRRSPLPPKLSLVELPPVVWTKGGDRAAMRAALANLRRAQAIESAAFYVPTFKWVDLARDVRVEWGWRTVGELRPREPGLPSPAGGDLLPCDLLLDWEPAEETAPANRVGMAERAGWPDRWLALDRAIRGAFPRASVVVLTYDNLAFTKLCLASLLANTDYPNYELIVVDNGSTDGTPDYLRELASRFPHLRLILNDANRGFGPANNQGLAAATGERLVLLNNDTIVPRGWLGRLLRHLDDPAVGLVGAATNRTCNEAQVDLAYATYGEFLRVARERAERMEGERVGIRMVAMFCAAFRRDVYEHAGPLDERYEVGMFEDEDYALTMRALGYDVVWAPEVYVHHAYHASIGKLLAAGKYMGLFGANMERFEQKWGICWERHRPQAAPPPR